jgi:uncharacterized protein (DUF1330 family)
MVGRSRQPERAMVATWDRRCPARKIAAPAIAEYGGRYLVRRAIPEVAEGDWAPPHPEGQQIIVVEFPCMEQLQTWYHSPEYAEALAVRKTAVNRRLLFVQGWTSPGPPEPSVTVHRWCLVTLPRQPSPQAP